MVLSFGNSDRTIRPETIILQGVNVYIANPILAYRAFGH